MKIIFTGIMVLQKKLQQNQKRVESAHFHDLTALNPCLLYTPMPQFYNITQAMIKNIFRGFTRPQTQKHRVFKPGDKC
jgi:hypothetical protein